MNARQKAKKYKRELQEYKSMVFKPTYVYRTNRPVEKLVGKIIIPFDIGSIYPTDIVLIEGVKSAKEGLVREAEKYVSIDISRSDIGDVEITAELLVARRGWV